MIAQTSRSLYVGFAVIVVIFFLSVAIFMAAPIDDTLILAGVALFLIALTGLKNPALLLIFPLLVLTLNQTTVVGGTALMQTARWVALGLTASYAVLQILFRTNSRKFRAADLIIILFILYAFISSIYAADPELSLQRSLSLFLLYLTIFWFGWYYADTKGEHAVVQILLIAAAIIYVASAAYSFFPNAWQRDGRFRGIMPNPNAIGLITSIYFPLLFWNLIKNKSFISLIIFVLAASILLLSGSRNGFVSVFAGMIFLIIRLTTQKSIVYLLILISIIFISSFIIFSSTDIPNILLNRIPVLERLLNIEAANYSSGRIESWASVTQQIEARPLFGYGFGMDAIGELILSRRSSQDIGVHNSYLAITYQLGIIGLIMFAVPMVLFLARSMLSTSRHRGEVFIYVLQAVVISGLVAAFFETWTHSVGNAFAFPFWMCVMLLVRTVYGEKVHQYAEAA